MPLDVALLDGDALIVARGLAVLLEDIRLLLFLVFLLPVVLADFNLNLFLREIWLLRLYLSLIELVLRRSQWSIGGLVELH